MPFFFEAAILSRTRSPMTSRSNWAKDSRMLRVSRPIDVVVLNCWVTATKLTACRSNNSTILAKSIKDRVRRSTFVDDHRVNPMLGDIGKQLPKRRALQGPAGEPAVIVAGLNQAPALTALTADERLASVALCMQGIEVLPSSEDLR